MSLEIQTVWSNRGTIFWFRLHMAHSGQSWLQCLQFIAHTNTRGYPLAHTLWAALWFIHVATCTYTTLTISATTNLSANPSPSQNIW